MKGLSKGFVIYNKDIDARWGNYSPSWDVCNDAVEAEL